MTPSTEGLVKVKRDGPRGWHWIAAESFKPDVHELYEEAEEGDEAGNKPKRKAAQKAQSKES